MMLEDTLIYNPPTALPFAALLAADLKDDGLDFYLRMAHDISTVANATNRSNEGAPVAESLLDALVAAPAGRTVAWRKFYRGVRTLVAGFLPAVRDDAHRDLTPAFQRLRQFVRENADLTETLAIGDLERAAYCQAICA